MVSSELTKEYIRSVSVYGRRANQRYTGLPIPCREIPPTLRKELTSHYSLVVGLTKEILRKIRPRILRDSNNLEKRF